MYVATCTTSDLATAKTLKMLSQRSSSVTQYQFYFLHIVLIHLKLYSHLSLFDILHKNVNFKDASQRYQNQTEH